MESAISKEKLIELIELYEGVLHGRNSKMGLFDCYDTYYSGCWDEDIKEIAKITEEVFKKK